MEFVSLPLDWRHMDLRKLAPTNIKKIKNATEWGINVLRLDCEFAEFCGIIMGDGNIWTNGRKYEITITGNPRDWKYLDGIRKYVQENIKRNTYYRVRGRGLRLTIYSKELLSSLFLISDSGGVI